MLPHKAQFSDFYLDSNNLKYNIVGPQVKNSSKEEKYIRPSNT